MPTERFGSAVDDLPHHFAMPRRNTVRRQERLAMLTKDIRQFNLFAAPGRHGLIRVVHQRSGVRLGPAIIGRRHPEQVQRTADALNMLGGDMQVASRR